MKILIVDDSTAMRRIIQRTLRQSGLGSHTIIEAENGEAGLAKCHAEKPNLILSDWNMPVLTGIEFLIKLRAENDKTPFGFITTEGTPEMRQKATESGADFLLEKPFTPEQMEATLNRFLS